MLITLGTNRIDGFGRLPSDLRRYLAYVAKLKEDYGSVLNFIVEKRLQWTDRELTDSDPFNNPDTGEALFYLSSEPHGSHFAYISFPSRPEDLIQ